MARTPLATRLQRAAAAAAAESREGDATTRGLTRRDLLRTAGATGAGLALASALGRPVASGATAPRIAIVGAGLAGLTCALDLRREGYRADIYEASDRIGGRCFTIRGVFADGQIGEHGGELIDSGQEAIQLLAEELGLELDDLVEGETEGTEPLGFFDGVPYAWDDATRDFKKIYKQLQKDVEAAPFPTTWDSYTKRGRELDRMSVADWIDAYVPGGLKSKLGQLLDIAYNIEYGAETSVQSSLNLIYLLGYSDRDFQIFGESDERYHIRGGNDQLTTRLADTIGPERIQLGTKLVAIAENSKDFDLWLSKGGNSFKKTFDKVVLALPFSVLRTLDYDRAGFEALKKTAIEEQGMGTNSKLHVQFSRRYWNGLGSNGETYSDRGYQNTWEVSRAQKGKSGILVNYTGGKVGAGFGTGTVAQRTQQFLGQIEPVLPGATAQYNGKSVLDFWTANPWSKGSYSYWKVGQYTKFSGIEAVQQGNCHFAGEHTSIDYPGYMNGAVESGQRAAAEILDDVRKKH